MEEFIKTYEGMKGLLRQVFEICEGMSRLNKFAGPMYEC